VDRAYAEAPSSPTESFSVDSSFASNYFRQKKLKMLITYSLGLRRHML
jgi:hypothetical protein